MLHLKNKPLVDFKLGASVRYIARIREKNTPFSKEIARGHNLINDGGMDLVASNRWANLTKYGHYGSGTNVNKRDSGAVTLSRTGTTVTASASFFLAADPDRIIKWDSGEEAYIASFTSDTEVETVDSGTIAADTGSVHYVDETALQTEIQRTSSLSADGGANGTSYSTGVLTFKRTFLFSAASGTESVNELGWGPANSTTVFGRVVLGSTVTLLDTQQLELEVNLDLSLPNTSGTTAFSGPITGWPISPAVTVDGDYGMDTQGVNNLQSNGSTLDAAAYGWFLEPSGMAVVAYLDSTTTAPTWSRNTPQVSKAFRGDNGSMATYTAGNFYRDCSLSIAVSDDIATTHRSLSIGGGNGFGSQFRLVFDEAQTKDGTHRLDITYRVTWSRTLVN